MELKTKGAGGGGAGREIFDSNTSLPAILTSHLLPGIQFVGGEIECVAGGGGGGGGGGEACFTMEV